MTTTPATALRPRAFQAGLAWDEPTREGGYAAPSTELCMSGSLPARRVRADSDARAMGERCL